MPILASSFNSLFNVYILMCSSFVYVLTYVPIKYLLLGKCLLENYGIIWEFFPTWRVGWREGQAVAGSG